MRRKVLRWFALLLPLIVLAGGIVRGERAVRIGEIWRFDIGGYDRRDLLRGRYLQFRIEEQWGNAYHIADEVAECACLERTGDTTAPTLHRVACEYTEFRCDSFIALDALQRLNRFYIPEARAKELEQVLLDAQERDAAQISVSVDRTGKATIVDLLIDGQPILEHRQPTQID